MLYSVSKKTAVLAAAVMYMEHLYNKDEDGPLHRNGRSAIRWIQRYVQMDCEAYTVPI